MGHAGGSFKSCKMRMLSYTCITAGSCVFFFVYLWMDCSFTEESLTGFNTDAVLLRDSTLIYQNRSGYSCARPNFTHMDLSEYHLPKEVHKDKFTVVVLTHNRTKILLQTLRHYANMSKVDRIIVTWNNQGVEPPPLQKMLNTQVPIVINIMPENKLRLRYQPVPEIRTQGESQRHRQINI